MIYEQWELLGKNKMKKKDAKINLFITYIMIFHWLHCIIYIKFNIRDMSMKKNSTSFRNKIKLTLQITTPTIPAIAALLMIIVLLVGTTTTAIIPAVLATTETVSIENRTDTEVTTQDDEGLADEEDENTSPPSTEAPEMEPSDTLNQTETEGQEQPPTSPSTGNQSEPTTLPSANSTNATAATTTANVTNTTDAGLDGRIVFAKSLSGDDPFSTDIYVMNADGSGGQTRLTRATDTGAYASSPSWSPDGGKIAFESDRDGSDSEIYVMNAEGSGVTQLTNNNASDGSPSWSPDGEKIAFVSDRAFQDPEGLNRNYEIYVMDADDGTPPAPRPQQIIDQAISTIEHLENIPQSLRTSIIALLRQVSDSISNATTDGTGTVTPSPEQTRLTNNNASDGSPSWSPDSEKIAFSSNRDGNSEIYVMNADDGSEQTRLTEESQFDGGPRWSPDGERIAFDSNRDERGIFVMNADDGSNVTHLTDGNGPAWSPDDEKLAFTSGRDAGDESDDNAIYVMNFTGAESSNATRLTEPDSYYANLEWSSSASTPDGGNGGNNTGGGGGNTTEPLTVQAIVDIDQDATPVVVFEASIDGGTPPYTCHWDLGDDTTSDACGVSHIYENPGTYNATITVTDSVGQNASDSIEGLLITPPAGNGTGGNNTGGIPSYWQAPVITVPDDITVQAIGPEGAPVSFQVTATETLEGDTYTLPTPPYNYLNCDHKSGETFPIGVTVVTCTAIGQVWEDGLRHTTQESFTITVEEEPPAADGEEVEPPADTVEEEPPAADDGEAEPPTNDTGGQ
jgi:Tol biopolymer transport system component